MMRTIRYFLTASLIFSSTLCLAQSEEQLSDLTGGVIPIIVEQEEVSASFHHNGSLYLVL